MHAHGVLMGHITSRMWKCAEGSCVDMPAPGAMLAYGVLMGRTANGEDGLRR